jgi:hypothetical protein
MLLALKRLGSDEKMGSMICFQAKCLCLQSNRKEPIMSTVLVILRQMWQVGNTAWQRDVWAGDGQCHKGGRQIFLGTFSPPKCRKLGSQLNNIVFVFTPSWDGSSFTSHGALCFTGISLLLSSAIFRRMVDICGVLVQISVLIYVGTYSCTYLAPRMTCVWPMRLTKICLLQLINLYKWHRTAVWPCSLQLASTVLLKMYCTPVSCPVVSQHSYFKIYTYFRYINKGSSGHTHTKHNINKI